MGTIFGGNLEKLVVGDHVTTIGGYAFNGATTLQDVTLGTGLNKIESTSFEGCSNLTKVRINSNAIVNRTDYHEQYSLTNIFGWLKEMTFGTEVTSIGDDVFNAATQGDYYPLEKVTFVNGSNIAVGAGAFQNCQNLTTVEGNIKSVGISSFENTKINRISIIEDAIIEKRAFADCSELTEAYLSYDLETIKEEAFYGCRKLTQLNLPSLVTVEKNAFKYCSSLVSIEFPENLATVDLNAFADCTSLIAVRFDGNTFANANWTKTDNIYDRFPKMKYLDFGPEVTAVHDYACYVEPTETSTLESIYIYTPAAIGKSAFENNKQFIKVEDAIKSVGYYAFRNCESLRSISISNATTIYEQTFYNCSSLNSVTLPENLQTLGINAFGKCSALREITLPASLRKIDESALRETGLKSIEIPSGVTEIKGSAFYGCQSLEEVHIPASATMNGGYIFDQCKNLKLVVCDAIVPIALPEGRNVFYPQSQKTAQLLVPLESVDAYKAAPVWKDFGEIFVIGGVKLQDGEAYTNEEEREVSMVRYTRTFSSNTATHWQAICVPFGINVEDYLDQFDIAELYAFCPYDDTNDDGKVDANDTDLLIVNPKKSGVTIPNVPYVIRAKEAKTYNITSKDCLLADCEAGQVTFATSQKSFKVVGILSESIIVNSENGYYYMATDGTLSHRTSGTTTLKPNRWYLEICGRSYGDVEENISADGPAMIRVRAIGEDLDEETAIRMIEGDSTSVKLYDGIYSINGTRVNETESLRPGFYIKNNKKILVK